MCSVVRFGLILKMRYSVLYIYIYIYGFDSNLKPLKKLTSSRRTEFKNIFPWNISQMITKTVPANTRIVISCAMKQGIPFWVSPKLDGNWDNNMIWISHWRESYCRPNTRVRKRINHPKKQGVKIVTEFTRSISSTRIKWWTLKSPKKNT